MTRAVHIGDTHLKPGPRNADRLAALDQIIRDHYSSQYLGVWLWPGDLNDARMSIDDRNALAARLQHMATFAPVVICYGNHDLPGDLDIFGRIKAKYPVFVIDKPQTLHLTLAMGEDAAIFCLPYPTRAGLAALNIAHGEQLAAADEALDFIFMTAGAELAEARSHGLLTLAIGHVNVEGAITSSGQPNIGHEISITAAHIARLGGCYVGLNHIHRAQQIGGAWYPGSICRLDWGEIEPKQYIVVEFTQAEHYVQNDVDPSFGHLEPGFDFDVRTPRVDIAPMYHVEGQLSREGFTYAVTAGPGGQAQPKPESWKGCEVRVRYRFPKSEAGVLQRALVQAEFAEAKRLELEPIAMPDRAVRAPEVAAARTLEDKARAWAASNGIEIADSVIEKLNRLQSGDVQSFLTDLATRLAETERQRDEVAA